MYTTVQSTTGAHIVLLLLSTTARLEADDECKPWSQTSRPASEEDDVAVVQRDGPTKLLVRSGTRVDDYRTSKERCRAATSLLGCTIDLAKSFRMLVIDRNAHV
jgi:hypothetical protein